MKTYINNNILKYILQLSFIVSLQYQIKSIHGTKTEQNLLKAFAGESQAYQRYYLFAQKAKQEGYEYLSKIFMDNAQMEQEHAKQYFSFLQGGDLEITATYPAGKVGTTEENLILAIAGEQEEHNNLYPTYGQIAEEEGFPQIAIKFKQIAAIEGNHARRFINCLSYLRNEQNDKLSKDTVWICMRCGHIVIGPERPTGCPVCLEKNCYTPVKVEWYNF